MEVLGLSGGELDAVTGQVVWDLELGPNERRTLSFGYVVTYLRRRALLGLHAFQRREPNALVVGG